MVLESPERRVGHVGEYGRLHPAADERMVAMRDGVRLASDVYLPDLRSRPVPAIVIRLPYDKRGRYCFVPQIAEYLTDRGYAVVAQDVRGKFCSQGERMPFVHEARDSYDTIDWVAGQPWCDGGVGMIGDSYYGFTQWAAAATGHPALRAIVPRMSSHAGPRRWFAQDEPLVSPFGTEWLARTWSFAGQLDGPVLDWTQRPHADAVATQLREAGLVDALHAFRALVALAADDATLTNRMYPGGAPAGRVRIPAMHVGGWWDIMKPGQLAAWRAASTRAPAAGDQYLVMGATDHEGLRFDLDGAARDDDGVLARRLPGMLDGPIAFLDRYLRGAAAPPAARVRYEIANGPWLAAPTWPPPDARPTVLHLVAAGTATSALDAGGLAPMPERSRSEARWVHEPADPVPSLVEDDQAMLAAPADERAMQRRPDVATFTGEAFERPLDLVGRIAAELAVGSSAPSTHIVAVLTDVTPDGRALMIAEGLAHVDTRLGPRRVVVELGSTAYRLLPRHRLRLSVCSSRFPRYLPHPGTDDRVWSAAAVRACDQRLLTGGPRGSLLRLSIRAS